MSHEYEMTISRMTVDKLGVKLYDKVSAVIAELVANSYDADATDVRIVAPMGEYLASKQSKALKDKGYVIEVADDGTGMTPAEINGFYLKVGAERRNDPKRGDSSKKYGRKVMGRKGVGKLAPFGICETIEIIASGGNLVSGTDENGEQAEGYLTAHFILRRSDIVTDTDESYKPEIGNFDGKTRPKTGMVVKLRGFDYRRVPPIENFERQLSRRFGLSTPNWRISLVDSLKTEESDSKSLSVGDFKVELMENTKIIFEKTEDTANNLSDYRVVDEDGNEVEGMTAGFEYENKTYPVTGWVGYSKQPYKDELMAGIRIYCRGKIAAQTHIFNRKAGFTGEYDIRSYLIGELHVDWLDESEDLIRTDRQDILWSHEIGQEFEKWGQQLVKKIGVMTRVPKRKRAWELFQEISKIQEVVANSFPNEDQKEIRENTIEMARIIAKSSREDELGDEGYVGTLVNLSMLMGPHVTLDRKLREAAETMEGSLSVITGILKTARIAELSAFGKIAHDRIGAIGRIEQLKDTPLSEEKDFQNLITEAPWLVDPQWSPVTSNQSFSTLKTEFEKYFEKRTGRKLALANFALPGKRADFVMMNQDNTIQIVEIKKQDHGLKNEEMDRINTYIEIMGDFLDEKGNESFKELFPRFHITLVCDDIKLTGVHKKSFESYKKEGRLTYINWRSFLLKTKKMHEEFLKEAERQKRHGTKM